MRSPALIAASSKAECHAVLASLSERYPPLEGRSPTRYSPVCHSTHGLLHFRVRLACVRHAASVDSEPGSNSHVKCAGCDRSKRPAHAFALQRSQHNSYNARPTWLCVVQSAMSIVVVAASRLARTDNDGRPIPRHHALTLLSRSAPRGVNRAASPHDRVCVCLHALSSFQRTDRAHAPRTPESVLSDRVAFGVSG